MRIKLNLLFLLILFFFSSSLKARYRAYKLSITDNISGEQYQVVTTLSPQVYIMYYEINRSFREINVVSTWMCWGNTSYFKPICPDPRDEEKDIEDANGARNLALIKSEIKFEPIFPDFYPAAIFISSSGMLSTEIQ